VSEKETESISLTHTEKERECV